jgi:hypothetical protein
MRRVMLLGCVLILGTVVVETVPKGDAERMRIDTHLVRTARALRASAPSGLSQEQREARRETIEWLDEYRSAGVFPHNHEHPSGRTPVFVDPHGTPCAVGYLMLRSGERELVARIAGADNLVRVPDLQDDERVVAWLEERGITLDEAARIQPTYGPREIGAVRTTSTHELATVGLSLATLTVAAHTVASGPEAGIPWIDALAIGSAFGQAALLFDRDGEPGWSSYVNAMGIVANVGFEVFRLARAPRVDAERPSGARPYVAPGRFGTEVGVAMTW